MQRYKETFIAKQLQRDNQEVVHYMSHVSEDNSRCVVLIPAVGFFLETFEDMAVRFLELGFNVLLFGIKPIDRSTDYNAREYTIYDASEEIIDIINHEVKNNKITFIGWSTGFLLALVAASKFKNTERLISLGSCIPEISNLNKLPFEKGTKSLMKLSQYLWNNDKNYKYIYDNFVRGQTTSQLNTARHILLKMADISDNNVEKWLRCQLTYHQFYTEEHLAEYICTTDYPIDFIAMKNDEMIDIKHLELTFKYCNSNKKSFTVMDGTHFDLIGDSDVIEHVVHLTLD